MRFTFTRLVFLVVAGSGGFASAEPFSWTEDFCASATANVFDGGPVLSEEACGSFSNESGFVLTVGDDTRPGTLGATPWLEPGRGLWRLETFWASGSI